MQYLKNYYNKKYTWNDDYVGRDYCTYRTWMHFTTTLELCILECELLLSAAQRGLKMELWSFITTLIDQVLSTLSSASSRSSIITLYALPRTYITRNFTLTRCFFASSSGDGLIQDADPSYTSVHTACFFQIDYFISDCSQ